MHVGHGGELQLPDLPCVGYPVASGHIVVRINRHEGRSGCHDCRVAVQFGPKLGLQSDVFLYAVSIAAGVIVGLFADAGPTSLDDPTSNSPGYNFRYADFYNDGLEEFRNQYKVYGLRLVITQGGLAGRFSVVPLFVNIGS